MFKFGPRKIRNLATVLLSSFCFSLIQQCVLADDLQDIKDLKRYISGNLKMTTLNNSKGNTYSIGRTVKKILESFKNEGKNTFEGWVNYSYELIFEGNCNNKCENNCWISSFAIIKLIYCWYESQFKLIEEGKPNFYFGLASHAIPATFDMINHTMVYVIVGNYVMLCDPLWGRISEIASFGENFEVLWEWFYGFYHNINPDQVNKPEQSGKRFDFFSIVKDILGVNPNNTNKGSEIFLSEDFGSNMKKSLCDLKWKKAEEILRGYATSGVLSGFDMECPGSIFKLLK